MYFKKTFIGVVVVLLLWQAISWLGTFNPIYFASPYEVFIEFVKMLLEHSIIWDLVSTLYRVIISILIATFIGVPTGVFLGYFSSLYGYVGGIVDFLRSIPPIVVYPLLLIILGPGNSSRIGVAIFGSVVVLVLIIAKGLFNQSDLRKRYLAILGASRIQIIRHIVWYEALPYMVGLRTAISLTIIIIVVTEMLVGARFGLGTRVQNVQITSNIPDLFATIIIIGLLGVLFNRLLVFLEKKYVFWKV